ncbi:MAG: VOC family protein [Verrucomicrobia bacterium]|nr:VOC family protein [Verrucomicrobiota bacterium]
MNFSVEHLGLPARDPVATKDWYVRILGGKMIFTDGKTPPCFFVQVPGGVSLEIYKATSSLKETADNKLAGFRHLAVRVDSIETARATLEQRGVKFTAAAGPAGGGGRVLLCFQSKESENRRDACPTAIDSAR